MASFCNKFTALCNRKLSHTAMTKVEVTFYKNT